ncbi:hypothetical protein FRC09_007464 [Ceratobasidium sp. 395]|nr:hypothetical protein FRC09_007464 [Ceratobasidium sp. 395]
MISTAKVVVIRPGFSTHAMNMGQRFIELESSYTGNPDGTGVLSVSQLPPNPAIIAPGPALVFVTVNGVPSVGVQIMVGSGQIGKQSVAAVQSLPSSSITMPATSSPNDPSGQNNNVNQNGVGRNSVVSALALVPALLFAHAWLFA